MAEQLASRPGDRILEIGAGTGYNAALLAAITGEAGSVVTVDVDEDIVAAARQNLASAGVGNVDVVLGDGALGYPPAAPYDRIIATVSAWDVPGPWLAQLSPGGRLVMPLRIRGASSRSIAFERDTDRWISRDSTPAFFMPLRGLGDDPRRRVTLTPGPDVTLQVHKDHHVDEHALSGVLDTPGKEARTGVLFSAAVPHELLVLWLCVRLDNPLMRMNITPAAVERAQVTPMFSWGSMATTRGGDLAYLSTRPASPAPDGSPQVEVGVIGHGPRGAELADMVAAEIVTWDKEHRQHAARFELPDAREVTDAAAGRFVLDRPGRPVTVVWQ
jgi:protein-L-isoaspartate(D-aspartate) O-methyltransferase